MVTLGLAGAVTLENVHPGIFIAPVLAFSVGLICACITVFLEHQRQTERAGLAARLDTELANETNSVRDSRVIFNNMMLAQGNTLWRPIWFTYAGFLAFLIGTGLGILSLHRITLSSTESSAPPAAITTAPSNAGAGSEAGAP